VILGPGGAITMVAMPIVGKLSQRGQARRLLVVGLTITAASLYLMSRFTLQADFWAVLKPRLWQGLGISMFFVPLTTLTVADVPRAQMGNATGLFNLVRNVGGAIGVSIVSTMLTRDAQRFQFRIAERLDAFDPNTAAILADLDHLLVLRGIGSPGEGHPSLPALYGQIVRDALMLAFNHTFFVLFVAVLVVSPAVFLFKRPARPRGSPAPVEL
jgi:DHA2 family multidrug resistance protein